jgi:hypothetical protein
VLIGESFISYLDCICVSLTGFSGILSGFRRVLILVSAYIINSGMNQKTRKIRETAEFAGGEPSERWRGREGARSYSS